MCLYFPTMMCMISNLFCLNVRHDFEFILPKCKIISLLHVFLVCEAVRYIVRQRSETPPAKDPNHAIGVCIYSFLLWHPEHHFCFAMLSIILLVQYPRVVDLIMKLLNVTNRSSSRH